VEAVLFAEVLPALWFEFLSDLVGAEEDCGWVLLLFGEHFSDGVDGYSIDLFGDFGFGIGGE